MSMTTEWLSPGLTDNISMTTEWLPLGLTDRMSMSTEWLSPGSTHSQDNVTLTRLGEDVWDSRSTLDLGSDDSLKVFVEFQVATAIDYYYAPVCSCLGILGNMWSFMTLMSASLRKSTTCQYMAAIAVADSMILVYNILFFVRKFPGYEIFNSWTCRLLFFLFFFTIHFDVAVMIAMTFEKYMAVRFPLHAASWKPRTKLIMATIALCMCALDAQNLFTRDMVYDEVSKMESCSPNGPDARYFLFQIWPWIDACVYCFIPLIMLFVLNILIIVWVSKSEKLRSTMGNSMSTRAPPKTASSFSVNSSGSSDVVSSNKIKSKEGQITRMLLLVSFTFLLLVGPMAVMIIVERQYDLSSTPHEAAKYHLARTVINNLMYTNHGLNFLLYCFSAKRFRKASLGALCCCRRMQMANNSFRTKSATVLSTSLSSISR